MSLEESMQKFRDTDKERLSERMGLLNQAESLLGYDWYDEETMSRYLDECGRDEFLATLDRVKHELDTVEYDDERKEAIRSSFINTLRIKSKLEGKEP